MLTYSPTSAFWVFNRVAHFAYHRYDLIIQDIQKVQNELETRYIAYTPAVDAAAMKLYEADPQLAIEFLTDYSVNTANATVQKWNDLSNYLLVKYIDGNVKQEKDGQFLRNPWGFPVNPSQPGYRDEWLKTIVNQNGEKFKEPNN